LKLFGLSGFSVLCCYVRGRKYDMGCKQTLKNRSVWLLLVALSSANITSQGKDPREGGSVVIPALS
jgi:hypothetical protein